MDLSQQIAAGEKAAYAMEYLGTKFDQLEADMVELWADVNMHDNASKDELLRSVKNLRKLRGLITADIANGDFARRLIQRSVVERARSAIGL